jgi:cyclopropane-fatty-acyl-phospholipid synthase
VATLEEISDTYDYMDDYFRLSLGETADITCAMYNGDFSMTLEEAQAQKHTFVLDALHCAPGSRVLDIGCGWGPMLHAIRERGAVGVGLTLSPRQAESCVRNGLDARLADWNDMGPDTLGTFDAITCVGAFEHFASANDYLQGTHDEVYARFFRLCHDLLRPGGRLYLQTMLWGPKAPRYEEISLQAPRGSNEYILAMLEKFYPGSFLPWEDQIVRVAAPYFSVVSRNNGRLDYIETMDQWGKRMLIPSLAKARVALRTVGRAVHDRELRYKLRSLLGGFNRECFKREVMDHQRMVFERTG